MFYMQWERGQSMSSNSSSCVQANLVLSLPMPCSQSLCSGFFLDSVTVHYFKASIPGYLITPHNSLWRNPRSPAISQTYYYNKSGSRVSFIRSNAPRTHLTNFSCEFIIWAGPDFAKGICQLCSCAIPQDSKLLIIVSNQLLYIGLTRQNCPSSTPFNSQILENIMDRRESQHNKLNNLTGWFVFILKRWIVVL